MKKITDKDVERLKAGKKITKGFIHMQLDDKGRLNLWSDINITDNYSYEKAWLVTYNGNEFYPNDERKGVSFYAIRVISQLI